jgi:hypothetical protein
MLWHSLLCQSSHYHHPVVAARGWWGVVGGGTHLRETSHRWLPGSFSSDSVSSAHALAHCASAMCDVIVA